MFRWLYSTVLLATCFVALASPASAQAFVVIVNAANPASTIASDDLSRIFLKRTVQWPNGTATAPVDLAPNDPSRDAFTKAVHGRSVTSVRAFWQQQIFSGRAVPPVEKAIESDVVAFVRRTVGAVAYVSAETSLGAGVKTIDIERPAR